MIKKTASNTIDKLINQVFSRKKSEIIKYSSMNQAENCMKEAFDLWMFMNRFRNCDLKKYFDEEIHQAIMSLNKKKHIHKIYKKKNYNLAYIITNIVDTGSASVPHRFMLKNSLAKKFNIKQHVLVTNLRNRNDEKETEGYNYLVNEIKPNNFNHLESNLTWLNKGNLIESWIKKNKIDFVLASPCPATIYAMAGNPAPIQGILSQDCYCFTLGPGAFDLTFYVTNDQVFKYKYDNFEKYNRTKLLYLPLHDKKYVDQAKPLSLVSLNIKKGSIVSASSNMWKSFFGDDINFLNLLKELILENKNYHHIFVGTIRGYDTLKVFLNKNPKLKNNIHFIGEVKNIYKLLKSIDFWVNSFPTSGGTDIEAAFVSKPTIEFIHNRNLTLHPTEFLASNECIVHNFNEMKCLIKRFIEDKKYRIDLGKYLCSRVSREYNKERIIIDRIYGSFIELFNNKHKIKKELNFRESFNSSITYEKFISFYNYEIITKVHKIKIDFLMQLINKYPNKPFAWIKIMELSLQKFDYVLFSDLLKKMPEELVNDNRIKILINFYELLSMTKKVNLKILSKGIDFFINDKSTLNDVSKYNKLKKILTLINNPKKYSKNLLKREISDLLPLFYNY